MLCGGGTSHDLCVYTQVMVCEEGTVECVEEGMSVSGRRRSVSRKERSVARTERSVSWKQKSAPMKQKCVSVTQKSEGGTRHDLCVCVHSS